MSRARIGKEVFYHRSAPAPLCIVQVIYTLCVFTFSSGVFLPPNHRHRLNAWRSHMGNRGRLSCATKENSSPSPGIPKYTLNFLLLRAPWKALKPPGRIHGAEALKCRNTYFIYYRRRIIFTPGICRRVFRLACVRSRMS